MEAVTFNDNVCWGGKKWLLCKCPHFNLFNMLKFWGPRHWMILAPQNYLIIIWIACYVIQMNNVFNAVKKTFKCIRNITTHWKSLWSTKRTKEPVPKNPPILFKVFWKVFLVLELLYTPKLNSLIFVRNSKFSKYDAMKNQSLTVDKVLFNTTNIFLHFQQRLVFPRKYV